MTVKLLSENSENEFNDIIIKVQKASEARDKIKQAIIKDQEGEKQIRGDKNSGMSFLEESQRIEG
jgi:hypothetical protein